MTMHDTDNIRIKGKKEVKSPTKLSKKYPITVNASNTVFSARQACHDIIHGEDDRLLVVVGPCSIHDVDAAKEYAHKLLKIREALKDDLHIVMRVYFEKPRTNIGWKGLINDPNLDNSFKINKGLKLARHLLLDLAELGMPAATEYLDLISPQYVSDLISWAAIGARTTESQVHRELASGVSCPVGFKNGTYGNMDVAINAVTAAAREHHFLSVDKDGRSAIFETEGNKDVHVILRGGKDQPNYHAEKVNEASKELRDNNLPSAVMVDCSHANSRSDYTKQVEVAADIADQLRSGSQNISGVMIESHLVEGNQKLVDGCTLADLVKGQSITDACISWETTETVLNDLADAVRCRRETNKSK